MALRIEPKAVKAAKGLPRQDWDRLKERLERIARDPPGEPSERRACRRRLPGQAGDLARDLRHHGKWRCQSDQGGTQAGGLSTAMSDGRKPINLVDETTDTVSIRRADFDALLADLEDAEDRAALLEHALAKAKGALPEPLTIEEADRLINGEKSGKGLAGEARADAACARKSCGDQPEPTCRDREGHQGRQRGYAAKAGT